MTTVDAAAAGLSDEIDPVDEAPAPDLSEEGPSLLPAVQTEQPIAFPEAGRRISLMRTYVDLAARVHATEFVPVGFRNKPNAVLAAFVQGLELGIGPMAALKQLFVSQDGKVGMQAELMRALIRREGHDFKVVEWTRSTCTVKGRRKDDFDPDGWLSVTFDLADAESAGLISGIAPNGTAISRTKNGNPGVWMKYTRAMLFARATAMLARAMFEDVLNGVSYTPEELGAEVTMADDGSFEVLDIPESGVRTGGGSQQQGGPDEDDEPDADANALFAERAGALPTAEFDELRAAWKRSDRLQAFTLANLPRRHMKTANAVLAGIEAKLKRTGWDPEKALADFRASKAGPTPPDSGPVEAGDAETGPDGGTSPDPDPGAEIDAQTEPDPDPEPKGDEPPPDGTDEKGRFDALAAVVQRWNGAQVDDALRLTYELPTGGNVETRRARLTMAMFHAGVEPESLF